MVWQQRLNFGRRRIEEMMKHHLPPENPGQEPVATTSTSTTVSFEVAVTELKRLVSAPMAPESLWRATDDSLSRLSEALELRARAAQEMLPARGKTPGVDVVSAAKAVAWAQLWDSEQILTSIKLQVDHVCFQNLDT